VVADLLGHASVSSSQVYMNSRELHQMNAFAQVAC
jgi:site-specific recombinase XerD